jgi:hypothetical protein
MPENGNKEVLEAIKGLEHQGRENNGLARLRLVNE